jgi:hypothetical protein
LGAHGVVQGFAKRQTRSALGQPAVLQGRHRTQVSVGGAELQARGER